MSGVLSDDAESVILRELPIVIEKCNIWVMTPMATNAGTDAGTDVGSMPRSRPDVTGVDDGARGEDLPEFADRLVERAGYVNPGWRANCARSRTSVTASRSSALPVVGAIAVA